MVIDDRHALDFLLQHIDVNTPVVVVGPQISVARTHVTFVVEDPPLGGPVAGIDAGLGLIETDQVAVLAVDMPFAGDVISELAHMFPDDAEAIVPVTADGKQQYLCGLYRVKALRRAIDALDEVRGAPMWAVVEELKVRFVELVADARFADCFIDVDTPEDLDKVRSIASKSGDVRE